MKKYLLLLIILVLGNWSYGYAQEKINADELFQQARTLAAAGKRQEAEEICHTILDRYPNYADVRILLGRLYAYEAHYDQARTELEQVVREKPDYRDARSALLDVEIWSKHPQRALELCDQLLDGSPNDEALLMKRAQILEQLGNYSAALVTLDQVLALNGANTQASSMRKRLQLDAAHNKVVVEYSYDAFDRTFEPWHGVRLDLTHYFPFGTVTGRVNYANRFSTNAVQYEVEAYPKFKPGSYAYLDFGYSPSQIFPRYRYGAEYYNKLPHGFEGSAGIRHLRFNSDDFTVYTGSLGKYYGNYYFAFRPYITPRSAGNSFSGFGIVRRYFGDRESYVTITAGAGSSFDQRVTTLDFFRQTSQKVVVEGRKRFGSNIWSTAFEFENQELPFNSSRKRYTVRVGFERIF